MGSIDRYIFRTTLASFAVVLVSLTGVIWITQALRGIDLMTSQGQTIITFLGVTSLVIPALVLIISPIALMIAISHTLNKLATDSEIIVMNAAGLSPFRLFLPFLYATVVVALVVAFISSYLAPGGMRTLCFRHVEIFESGPGRHARHPRTLPLGIACPCSGRSGLHAIARSVPRRVARPFHGPDLPIRIRRAHFCLSGRTAHYASK